MNFIESRLVYYLGALTPGGQYVESLLGECTKFFVLAFTHKRVPFRPWPRCWTGWGRRCLAAAAAAAAASLLRAMNTLDATGAVTEAVTSEWQVAAALCTR